MLAVSSVLLLLFLDVNALVCPPIQFGSIVSKFTDGNDGSCYSEVENEHTRTETYAGCARYNSYLPFVLNAFQNAVLQQKAQQGTYIFGLPLPGMWLGLTCTGNQTTSCSWDDGTPVTSKSYTNFDTGFPNATIGPCVYQDVNTGLWKSESCSLRKDIGYYCKFTPTNNVPMCSPRNSSIQPFPSKDPDYFGGFCYYSYDFNEVNLAENACNQDCAHIASIHSEAENSFVRDLLVQLWVTDAWSNRGYLGMIGNESTWLDGTDFDYTSSLYDSLPGFCLFLSADDSSQVPVGSWFRDACTQPFTRSVICKKTVLNECDSPYVPFPTKAPVLCIGPEYLSISGELYSPGYPYYPQGEEPNTCEYIHKLEEGLHPSVIITFSNQNNFLPATNISRFDFYSSEDSNSPPFYSYQGNTGYFTLSSPTNILRSIYTTVGDSRHPYDWVEMVYNGKQKLSCTMVMDYSYLGYYNQSASDTYSKEMIMIGDITSRLAYNYNNNKCQLDFSWNSAAYGNVASSYSTPSPANYTSMGQPYITSTGSNSVDLCSFIDHLNSVQIPKGTENSCLVFFSGRSAQDFAACKPVDTKKYKYTFGVAINGATGVSSLTTNVVNVTDFTNFNQEKAVMEMIINNVRPDPCK